MYSAYNMGILKAFEKKIIKTFPVVISNSFNVCRVYNKYNNSINYIYIWRDVKIFFYSANYGF